MNRQRTLEWEARWAVPAAVSAFLSALLFLVNALVVSPNGVVSSRSPVDQLTQYDEVRGTMLLVSVLVMVSLALFAVALVYLFKAAAARSQGIRYGFIGLVAAGPILFGAAGILQHFTYSNAAAEFATPGGGAGIPIGEYADDLVREQVTTGLSAGFGLAGIVALVFGVIYTALWAMRVGLVTRFFGTFGMALGASLPLFGATFSLLALMFWIAWLGLIYIGKVPGGPAPAWAAGEAVPWPKPGEAQPAPERDIDAEASELFADAEEVDADSDNPNAARRERAKRRKRKRRRS
ncbi:MAG: hypothetical protein ACR2G3_09625 [Solirubrobacterales bacterium]